MKKILTVILAMVVGVTVYCSGVPKISTSTMVAYAVQDYIKENIHDPKSFKVVGNPSVVYEFSNGTFGQTVTFRAKNGYGALVKQKMTFIMIGTGWDTRVVGLEDPSTFLGEYIDKGVTIVRGHRKSN